MSEEFHRPEFSDRKIRDRKIASERASGKRHLCDLPVPDFPVEDRPVFDFISVKEQVDRDCFATADGRKSLRLCAMPLLSLCGVAILPSFWLCVRM